MQVLKSGIDVSSHQGRINWEDVKASGKVDFVMIRVGFRGYGNGKINPDKYFDENIKEASAQGLQIGAYFFSTALTEAEAQEEALYCIDKLKGYSISLPVVFDFEGFKNKNYRTYGISKEQRTANCKAFNDIVSAANYKSMLYGSKGNIRTTYDIDVLSYPLWIAQYAGGYKKILADEKYFPDMGAYNARIAIWQYTSIGKVNGINGNVDMNQMYIDVIEECKCSVPTLTLYMGNPQMSDADVKWLRQKLAADGYSIALEGAFDKTVEAILRDYQRKHNLVIDGKCGKFTRMSMNNL